MTEYKEVIERISRILFEEDPIGINFEENTDEYDPEARTIAPRLKNCETIEEIQIVVHEEFCKWFDQKIAGDLGGYRKIAERIWTVQHAPQIE
jgi:hypothetical protein